ncbi:hypothetical protein D9758_016060 [Tetrapyrgos nigripes]|uniref:Integrase catalytic domain-containing protein n=1 Tax=Tetrapyrgos nigripes TaxID=182062 RepID=A0A8H5C7A5_9AGAR|nr:hypothetical protein D9758_016060 [Tetrapyrgos nigripes]
MKKLVELMKNRTAEMIITILSTLKTKAKVQTGRKLKRIRMDNAPEWALMQEWTTKHGIEHEFTAPYTSPSNSIAECGVGVLLEGTRQHYLILVFLLHGGDMQQCLLHMFRIYFQTQAGTYQKNCGLANIKTSPISI